MNNYEMKLKELIKRNAVKDVSLEDISNESNLAEDFGYDSLAIVQLITDIEVDFDIEINFDTLDVDRLVYCKYIYEVISKLLDK